MWQAATFDKATIRRELGWAHGLGFNTIRVFLHNVVWEEDPTAYKKRIRAFLAISAKAQIRVMFVLFDDCWNTDPHPGPQPAPIPGVHNSRWVECPGKTEVLDSSDWPSLEKYTKDIISSFRKDPRVLLWDLYNEPGNDDLDNQTLPLLKSVFIWARESRPSQPLTSGIWSDRLPDLSRFQLENSDVISFHNYGDTTQLVQEILRLDSTGRPLICSEYMARTNGSRFITHLPVFKKYRVGAINWGLVSGKTNTIFPWGSQEGAPEPAIWFHDIFHKDGRPYDPAEISLIRSLTKATGYSDRPKPL